MALWLVSIKSFLFQLNNQPEFNKNEFQCVILQNDDLWDGEGLCKFCWSLFICLCLASTKKKLPSAYRCAIFSPLLRVSPFAVTIPSRKGREYHQLPSAPPLKWTFCHWDKRWPKSGFSSRASILSRHSALSKCHQRHLYGHSSAQKSSPRKSGPRETGKH